MYSLHPPSPLCVYSAISTLPPCPPPPLSVTNTCNCTMRMQYKFLFKACVCVTNLPRNVSETQCMRNAYVFHQLCNACAYHKAQAQHCGHRCCRRLYAKAHRSSENTNVLARTKTHAHAHVLACTHMHTCTHAHAQVRAKEVLSPHTRVHTYAHTTYIHML